MTAGDAVEEVVAVIVETCALVAALTEADELCRRLGDVDPLESTVGSVAVRPRLPQLVEARVMADAEGRADVVILTIADDAAVGIEALTEVFGAPGEDVRADGRGRVFDFTDARFAGCKVLVDGRRTPQRQWTARSVRILKPAY